MTTDKNLHCSMRVTETRRHKAEIKINDADRRMINVDVHVKLLEITQQPATCRTSTISSLIICTIRLILFGRSNQEEFDEPHT
jgi:hypothetical protein